MPIYKNLNFIYFKRDLNLFGEFKHFLISEVILKLFYKHVNGQPCIKSIHYICKIIFKTPQTELFLPCLPAGSTLKTSSGVYKSTCQYSKSSHYIFPCANTTRLSAGVTVTWQFSICQFLKFYLGLKRPPRTLRQRSRDNKS